MGIVVEIYKVVPSPWNMIILTLVGIAFLVLTLIRTIRFVPQGEEALLLRWNSVVYRNGKPVYKKPGRPHIMLPWVNNLVKASTLDYVFTLHPITLKPLPFQQVDVSATVVFEVVDIEGVLYGADDFNSRLIPACEWQLRECLKEIPLHEIESSLEAVTAAFRLRIVPVSKKLGVRFKELNITNVAYNGQISIARAIATLAQSNPGILEELGVSPNGHKPA